MALSIRDRKVEALAREVARTTGESLTEAILHALEDRQALRSAAGPGHPQCRGDPRVAAGRHGGRMVIDTSALLALLLDETAAREFARVIAADPRRLISAFTALETSILIEAKKGPAAAREFDLLVYKAGLDVVPMDAAQAEIARGAWRTFGRGRHPAGLNIGDCCSYALSRLTGEPLLFKGEDFARTDVHRLAPA